jgi:hypothetical protein
VSKPFLPPLVRNLPADVVRARLPTPFPVGTVNCYLLVEPPVTVVDPGTLTRVALERLRAMLAGAGCSLEDIEQVVVTHAHTPTTSVRPRGSPAALAGSSWPAEPRWPRFGASRKAGCARR